MLVPHIEAIWRVGDIRKVDLRLDRLSQCRARRLQRRLQLVINQKLRLAADRDAGPSRVIRYCGARVETRTGVMRYLPRGENRLVAHDCRDEPGGWRRGDARWIHLANFAARLRHHRNQRGRNCRGGAEQALHDH
jgi:hypothetical protein